MCVHVCPIFQMFKNRQLRLLGGTSGCGSVERSANHPCKNKYKTKMVKTNHFGARVTGQRQTKNWKLLIFEKLREL